MSLSGTLKGMKQASHTWLLLPFVLAACAHAPRGMRGPETEAGTRGPSSETRSCQPLAQEDRLRLLEVADPARFPATRYHRGPNRRRGVEKETDCSHFVHEIYRRAGLPYAFRTTSELPQAREFDILPEKQALPGDLMLFRGHVGLVSGEGKIISAVRTKRRRRKSSIAVLDRRNFRSFRGERYVLRYRCRPVEPRIASAGEAAEP